MSNAFNFEGGEELSAMGATWFVSFSYYDKVDPSHLNWKEVKTFGSRRSVYYSTVHYHRYWLNEILKMSINKLNTNSIGLDGNVVKKMAEAVLKKMSVV